MNTDRNELGYSVLSEEEILQAVSRPDEEDEEEEDELIRAAPTVPSHNEAYACLSMCTQQLEAQADCNPVTVQLLQRLQQSAARKQAIKLMQQHITKFFDSLYGQ